MIRKQVVRFVDVNRVDAEEAVQKIVDEMAEEGMFLASLNPGLDNLDYNRVWLVFKEPNKQVEDDDSDLCDCASQLDAHVASCPLDKDEEGGPF